MSTADLADRQHMVESGVWGLAWTPDGRLLAGWQEYPRTGGVKATLMVSTDDGASFEPLMSLCDVEPRACPQDSIYARACPARWAEPKGFDEDFRSQSCMSEPEIDAGVVPADAGGPATDSGAPPDPPGHRRTSDGCSVVVGSVSAPGGVSWWWAVGLSWLLRARIARARRPASTRR